MLSFHDPLPELAGKKCSALLVQEHSHANSIATPIAVLLDTGEQWHRFFIDAGVVFWKTHASQPAVAADHGLDRYHVRDASDMFGGHQIAAVRALDLPGGGEIRVEFYDAPAAILRDVDDLLSFQIQRDATSAPNQAMQRTAGRAVF